MNDAKFREQAQAFAAMVRDKYPLDVPDRTWADSIVDDKSSAFVAPSCCRCCGGGPLCPKGTTTCCVQRIRARVHPLVGDLILREPDCTCEWKPTGRPHPYLSSVTEHEFVPCGPCVKRAEERVRAEKG